MALLATQTSTERLQRFPALYKSCLLRALDTIDLEGVSNAIEMFEQARSEGRTIFVCGNGGSAATASHFVCDMVKGASYQKQTRFRIIALTDSVPTITAYSNDVAYECIFRQQLENFARPGDLVLGISGSGSSPNVVSAIEYAKSAGCRTIVLTGRDGGVVGPIADLQIQVAEPHMGRIEDGHMIVCHMICYYFMEE